MLKQLIQLLLDSRTTPEEAGHSAMPSPTEVSLTPSVTSQEVWGDVCTGIASSDGYIRMNFGATSPEAIGSARSFGAVAFSTPQQTGDIVSVICPVAKGRAYAMSVRNANNITCAFVKLIGSIGGGQALKNALLQGGVLCRLSRLYSSLRRSSLLVRRSGSLNSVTRHPQTLSSFRFQTIITCILTLHQRTVCLCLGNLVRQELVTWKSPPLVRDLISISQALEFTKVLQCRLIEAKRFLSRQPQITEEFFRSFTSSRLSVKREVGLGGASC